MIPPKARLTGDFKPDLFSLMHYVQGLVESIALGGVSCGPFRDGPITINDGRGGIGDEEGFGVREINGGEGGGGRGWGLA